MKYVKLFKQYRAYSIYAVFVIIIGPCPFISTGIKGPESLQPTDGWNSVGCKDWVIPSTLNLELFPGLYPDIPTWISFDLSDVIGDNFYFADIAPFIIF